MGCVQSVSRCLLPHKTRILSLSSDVTDINLATLALPAIVQYKEELLIELLDKVAWLSREELEKVKGVQEGLDWVLSYDLNDPSRDRSLKKHPLLPIRFASHSQVNKRTRYKGLRMTWDLLPPWIRASGQLPPNAEAALFADSLRHCMMYGSESSTDEEPIEEIMCDIAHKITTKEELTAVVFTAFLDGLTRLYDTNVRRIISLCQPLLINTDIDFSNKIQEGVVTDYHRVGLASLALWSQLRTNSPKLPSIVIEIIEKWSNEAVISAFIPYLTGNQPIFVQEGLDNYYSFWRWERRKGHPELPEVHRFMLAYEQ